MASRLQDVRCARIPIEGLSVLADLRRESAIRVTIVQGRAWVCWDDGPGAEVTQRVLVGRLLPLAGVELFARRDGRWYRPAESLPAFHVPADDATEGASLDRVILPEPLTMLSPGGDAPRPVALQLVHDETERSRPATALRCRLADLARWADWAPSDWIESLSGARCATPSGDPDRVQVLLLGHADSAARTEPRLPGWRGGGEPPRESELAGEPDPQMARPEPRPPGGIRLPALADGLRFWGSDVLIPLGYRAEPPLAERALRAAVGAGPDDVVVMDGDGPELIPRRAFRPLRRAGIRLARKVEAATPSTGGGRI
jgi:hypothetical protein